MDMCNWTPNKVDCDSIVMLSPITKTPIRQNSLKFKKSFQNNTNGFSVLPNHITPPSGLTKFIARNPFEADLTSKLHISVMSPTVFSKVSNTSEKSSSEFTWSIDELALIHPAKIDEFPIQQMHCSDPEIEKNAQEAISRFFNENQIIPSPFDVKNEKRPNIQTPLKEESNSLKESYRLKKDTKESWTQTVLTLPPELPAHIEEILKPYFNFTQDQNCENEEANTSNSSLRRKLFVNHDDSQDESINSCSGSPSVCGSPLLQNLSPPQSGIFFHGTPLRSRSQIIQRTYGTPLAGSRNSSPCDVSPINSTKFEMSCQSIKSRNKSVAKLDFTTDMSIEIEEEKKCKSTENTKMCKTLFSEQSPVRSDNVANQYTSNEEKYYDVTQTYISNENSVQFKYEDKENIASNNYDVTDRSKAIDICKSNFSESYAMQQSKMISGNCMQQMAFNSAQDTGYQTYSSSNITNNMDSYSMSIKQKLNLDERNTQVDDEVQLDWRENMKNMISSTPSKFNRGISHF